MRTEFGACFLVRGCPCNIAKVGSDGIVQPQQESPPCGLLFLTRKVREKVLVNCWVPETRLQFHQHQRGPSFTPWEREWSRYSAYCSPPLRLSQKGHKETFRGKGNTLCLDRNVGYMGVCVCPKYRIKSLKISAF